MEKQKWDAVEKWKWTSESPCERLFVGGCGKVKVEFRESESELWECQRVHVGDFLWEVVEKFEFRKFCRIKPWQEELLAKNPMKWRKDISHISRGQFSLEEVSHNLEKARLLGSANPVPSVLGPHNLCLTWDKDLASSWQAKKNKHCKLLLICSDNQTY